VIAAAHNLTLAVSRTPETGERGFVIPGKDTFLRCPMIQAFEPLSIPYPRPIYALCWWASRIKLARPG